MYSLAIDTSCGNFSIALAQETEIQDYIIEPELHKQSENIMDCILVLSGRNNLSLNDIHKIGLTLGPGSFTGSRIGLAAAQGIKLVTASKLIGTTTLQTISMHFEGNKYVVLPAGRKQWYCQYFRQYTPIGDIELIDENMILQYDENNMIIGYPDSVLPEARGVIKAMYYGFGQELGANSAPIYVRQPDAVKKSQTTLG